jgi:hypothetical protein
MLDLGPWRFIHLAIVGTVLAAATWVMFARNRRRLWIDRELAWYLWHWFTGGPLETSRSAPCRDLDRFACWRNRAALGLARSTCAAGLVACEYVRSGAPSGTGWTMAIWGYGGAVVLAAAAVVLANVAVRVAIYLWWVRPVAAATRKLAGWKENKKAIWFVWFRRMRGYWGLGLGLRVSPACDVSEANLDRIVNAVRTRAAIDLGDVDHQWKLDGLHSSIRFRPAARIPARVAWTDEDGSPNQTVRAMVTAPPPGVIWLGQGKDGMQVTFDLNRHPHVLVSAPTGAGKSAIARAIVSQLMVKDDDCEVVSLDAKVLSQAWLRDLPGARSLHMAEEVHQALIDLSIEARARMAVAELLPRAEIDAYVASLTRKVLVIEEAPSLMDWLQDWWHVNRPRGARDVSPAVLAMRELLNMGRMAGFNIIGLAQRADAKAMGGGAARENYVLRILLAGYSKRAHDMLVEQHDYVPLPDIEGRALVSMGATATETQLLWLTDDEAEALVAGRRGLLTPAQTQRHSDPATVPLGPPADSSLGPPGRCVAPTGNLPGQGLPPSGVVGRTDEHDDTTLVTLREAVESGLIATSLTALQRAASRAKKDGVLPEPVVPGNGPDGPQYWDQALVRWWDQRPRSPKRRREYEPLVYFIVRGGKPRYGDVVKIGRTDNLTQRLDSFADHPGDVVRKELCKTTEDSKAREREYHERWARERVYPDRELFRIENSLADYLGVPRREEVPA